jgi:hypothetical protein
MGGVGSDRRLKGDKLFNRGLDQTRYPQPLAVRAPSSRLGRVPREALLPVLKSCVEREAVPRLRHSTTSRTADHRCYRKIPIPPRGAGEKVVAPVAQMRFAVPSRS